jgi:hypothetical protein
VGYNLVVMESPTIREPVLIEPKMIITLIKEGQPSVTTEKQKAYQEARVNLLNPHIRFTPDLISTTLKARSEELDEVIANSPLKGLTDRGGYPLGSLKELTSLAAQELSGELHAKTILKRQLEMITSEEEARVREGADYLTREGVIIDKDGSIVVKSFPSQNRREMASVEAQHMKENFLKGKQRLQDFVSTLK